MDILRESTFPFLIYSRGKIMLASWRGTRFECAQVLREVCDHVLKDPGVPDIILVNRAKVPFPRSPHLRSTSYRGPMLAFRLYLSLGLSSRRHNQMDPISSDES
jgi:hypothetical protein